MVEYNHSCKQYIGKTERRLKYRSTNNVDCKTVGRFFLKISKEIVKAWRKSVTRAKRASLTRPQRLSPVSLSVLSLFPDLLFDSSSVLEYAKIRTVLQVTNNADQLTTHLVSPNSPQSQNIFSLMITPLTDITLIPLELITCNRDSVRKAREAYLIKRGKTLEPLGINKKDEM